MQVIQCFGQSCYTNLVQIALTHACDKENFGLGNICVGHTPDFTFVGDLRHDLVDLHQAGHVIHPVWCILVQHLLADRPDQVLVGKLLVEFAHII